MNAKERASFDQAYRLAFSVLGHARLAESQISHTAAKLQIKNIDWGNSESFCHEVWRDLEKKDLSQITYENEPFWSLPALTRAILCCRHQMEWKMSEMEKFFNLNRGSIFQILQEGRQKCFEDKIIEPQRVERSIQRKFNPNMGESIL